jgi:outer membrane scaffolding protein for murein synthesis (MipA/OmpV family)
LKASKGPQRQASAVRALGVVRALAAALAFASLPAVAQIKDAPLWELGLGVTGLRLPDYRGSDQYRSLVLPLPYFVYRGDFFRSDREGVRGVLFNSTRVSLNVSAGASLPVSSSHSDTRAGMPNLKPEIELGPALDWTLWRGRKPGTRLVLSFPVRAAISLEWPPRSLGWITNPHLNLDLTDPMRLRGWDLGLQAGPLFATRRLNDYTYSVDRAYATATRPAYAAPGGYAGMQFTTSLSKRFRNFWVGGFARYDSVRNAVFEDSPLVRSGQSIYGGIGVAVIIRESTIRVPRTEDDY